ncbi:uncharacterized protein LOC131952453 isoform X2 [Physella acuta]|uniref:uncharacterized protein LOC131952453 isoform X2 n=1 Tax=Physella acuta TaxID=109671 RepID=UPI0027DB61CC|nr:uncharacterized protein LOC131952453 isoform X2 [Physella acuta]
MLAMKEAHAYMAYTQHCWMAYGRVMSSENKEVQNDFIDSSTGIDKLMDNENHDINKHESAIQDLARYLSSQEPHKDSMMVDDKQPVHESSYSSAQTGQHYASLQASPACGPLSYSHESTSSNNSQQFLQHRDSFDQSAGMFPQASDRPNGGMLFSASSAFDNVQHGEAGNLQPLSGGSELQYYSSGAAGQYQPDTDLQFHHSLHTQQVTQADSSSFQNTSTLSHTFSPASGPPPQFNGTQDNLSYTMMEVNHSDSASQFKVLEKMHVDEPEGDYLDGFEFKAPGSSGVPMKNFSPEMCQSAEASGYDMGSFTHSLACNPLSDNYSGPSCDQNSSFDVSNNQYPVSSSSFDSAPFIATSIEQPVHQSPAPDSVQSSIPAGDYSAEGGVSQLPGSEFSLQPSHTPSSHSYVSSLSSPTQSSQFTEASPSSSPAGLDNFQANLAMENAQTSNGFQPINNFTQSLQNPQDQSPFHNADGAYGNNVDVLSPEQQPAEFRERVNSTSSNKDIPAVSLPEQHTFMNNAQVPSMSEASDNYYTPSSDVNLHHADEITSTAGGLTMENFTPACVPSSSEQTQYADHTGAFSHLDLASVVNCDYTSTDMAGLKHASLDMNTTAETTMYSGYNFITATPSVSFPETIETSVNQSLGYCAPGLTSLSTSSPASLMETQAMTSHPVAMAGEGTFPVQTNDFVTTRLEPSFSGQTHPEIDQFPQPMLVQETDFLKKMEEPTAFPYPTEVPMNTNSIETAMDISSSQAERSISFEEIHRSIVNAGKQFASTTVNNNNRAFPESPMMAKSQSSELTKPVFTAGPSGSADYTPLSEDLTLSSTVTSQSNFVTGQTFSPPLNTFDSSLSNSDQRVLSGILDNIQQFPISSQSAIQQEMVGTQVPNFLDAPRVSVADASIPDGSAPAVGQTTCYVVTVVGSTLGSPSIVVANPTMNQPKLVVIPSSATSQQPVVQNPLLVSPVGTSTGASSLLATVNNSVTPSFAGLSSLPAGLFIQSPDSAKPALVTIAGKVSQPAAIPIKSSLPTVIIPAGTLSSGGNNNQNSRQIMLSLEELQKLLSQQSLSRPSQTIPIQQPAASATAHTLVFQKPAVHSVKQQQPPKLLIRNATFSSQPRHVQQQPDKLQLIVQPSNSSQMNKTCELIVAGESQKSQASLQASREFQQKLQLPQPPQMTEQPKISLQLKSHVAYQPSQNLVIQHAPSVEQKSAPFQLLGQKQQYSALHTDLKTPYTHVQVQPPTATNVVPLAQMQQELLQLQKQQEPESEFSDKQLKHLHLLHQLSKENSDRMCSENVKKDFKHLHGLLTSESTSVVNAQNKALPPVLNFPTAIQGNLQLSNGTTIGTSPAHMTPVRTFAASVPSTSAPFSFLNSTLPPGALNPSGLSIPSHNSNTSAPLTTLAFTNVFSSNFLSKSFETKEVKSEVGTSTLFSLPHQAHNPVHLATDAAQTLLENTSNQQNSLLAQILRDKKRSHSPLTVDIGSPQNSNSEAPSPLSSPHGFEDGNTQSTLIQRSEDLHIKSDTLHSVNDDDDDENASFFDMNAFHKRPSTEEILSTRGKDENVPMKILKGSLNADARSSIQPPPSPEHAFDIGSVVSTASNFSFAFGNKEDNLEVFTFGSTGTNISTTDTLLNAVPKSSVKGASVSRTSVPTQSVRPQTRKQKEYSLKAYYSSKLDNIELKILEQPEPHHRARYQTEGSRGAIKDASQQGFPVIKLIGYSKPTKLQVFIGDECGRVKPHGFYQACRVFGKNSTSCTEQEIEGTTVIEIDMLPENEMIVKLDCIGILKLRNADVERRIGPKRARDKKKHNTRARLVIRTFVEKVDGSQHVLQVVSNPIVCTQPVGQPEISRMSLTECTSEGGQSLFIIGKNFKNKGTSVLFQKLDANDEAIIWQAEAEIEQEFFQPTHLICKVPPYKDQLILEPEQIQIVVSCAGKKSDSHSFYYKPVYQVAPIVKPEVPMETDSISSTKTLSFVSPEALHLNKMVHQAHVQSSTSNSVFQLPPGTIPHLRSSQTVLDNLSAPEPQKPVTVTGYSPAPVGVAHAVDKSVLIKSESYLKNMLLEENSDNLLLRSDAFAGTDIKPAGIASDTSKAPPATYTVVGESFSNTTSNNSVLCHNEGTSTPATVSTKPIFVVVDSERLQLESGEMIQQLLRLFEAQSKQIQ